MGCSERLPAIVARVSALVLLVLVTAGCSTVTERLQAAARSDEETTTTTAPPEPEKPEPAVAVLGEPLPRGDLNASADGSPPRLTGRFGSGLYGPVTVDVIEVRRERTLRLSLRMVNLDRVNPVELDASRFTVVVPRSTLDGPTSGDDGTQSADEAVEAAELAAARERADRSRPDRYGFQPMAVSGQPIVELDAGERSTKTLTFDLPDAVPLSLVEIEYTAATVPLRFPLIGDARPVPYPVDLAVDPSGDGGSDPLAVELSLPGCEGSYRLVVRRAWVDVHLPVSIERTGNHDPRAPVGHRWLSLDLSLERTDGEPCERSVLAPNRFQLAVDGGLPVSPRTSTGGVDLSHTGDRGGNANVGSDSLIGIWAVPLGTSSAELIMPGARVVIDLPDLPAVYPEA